MVHDFPGQVKNDPLGTRSYHVRNLNAHKAPSWKKTERQTETETETQKEREREREMFQEPRCSRPSCLNLPSPGGR